MIYKNIIKCIGKTEQLSIVMLISLFVFLNKTQLLTIAVMLITVSVHRGKQLTLVVMAISSLMSPEAEQQTIVCT